MKVDTSLHQKRLWFTDKFEAGSLYESNPVYFNVPLIIKIEGNVNISFLEKGIFDVINRHEALRTKIITENGKSFQLISEKSNFKLKIYDFKNRNDDDSINFVLNDLQKPFSLDNDSLFRASLVKLSDSKFILLICCHNIICDRYSLKLLAEEIFLYYESYSKNSGKNLSVLTIHFADFAQWQNELPDEVLEPFLFYWKKKLDGKLSALEIPFDYPREAIHVYKSGFKSFEIQESLTEEIKEFCRKEKINCPSFFLTAFKILLYKYSSQYEIIVGTFSENREQEDLKGVVGTIENLLALRTFVHSSDKAKDLIFTIEKNFSEAIANHVLPFDKLVTELKIEKDMSRMPLFDVVFRYEEKKLELPQVENLSLEVIETNLGFGKYDFNLLMQKEENIFKGILTYNTLLFSRQTIERYIEHYKIIIENILKNPDEEIGKIKILTKIEENRILREWNDRKANYPKEQTIHGLFERQVKETPENIAIVFENKKLSYRELNNYSNLLAGYLRKNYSIQSNDLICLLLDKSEWMIIALLAVLKSGGAYVPIDPSYPQERINYILKNSRSKILITDEEHKEKISKEFQGNVIDLNNIQNKFSNESPINLDNINKPDDTAYIIYTSGTTGNPKGCMISHSNVVRLMVNDKHQFEFNEKDVWIMAHSFCFDFSVWEMYGALLYGGKLIIPQKEEVRDVSSFLSLIKQNKVSVLNQTPLAFYNLMAEESKSEAKTLDFHLRYVIFGGDKLEPQKLKSWVERYSLDKVQLINMYGITETTVHVTYYKITESDISSSKSVSPIGKPIPDETTVYIFDDNMNLVPIGVKGEFFVGGSGVSKGYLFNKQLTEERFIKNPFNSEERIYRTGDVGFWYSDGNLEYVRRKDNQVKIRGFRIELGEIENSILNFENIKEAVVLAREEKADDKRLAAYVVSKDDTFSTSKLRQFLKDRLPEYMIPSSFVVLKQLPMTSNGKIDKDALANICLSRNDLESRYVPPQTPEEEILVKIWQEVICIDKVGVHDNFFELGGDSIISIQIISKANQAGLKITPKQIFQYQTIAELSSVICNSQITSAEQRIITGEVPLTPIQKWFFEQNLPDPNHYNHSVLLKVPSGLNTEYLEATIRRLIEHHDSLRLRFKEENSLWKQINVDTDNEIPFSVQDLSRVSNEEQGASIKKSIGELQTSLSLSNGPLIRIRLFILGLYNEDRLLIIIHHLCIDGISWRILLEDFYNCYNQLSCGENIRLPFKTTSFKDWSNKLYKYSNSEKLLEEKEYWLSILENQINSIPTDISTDKSKNTVESIDTVSIILDDATTESLLQEVPKAYNTKINDVLLTSLAIAYGDWADEKKVLISLEGHGREEIFDSVDLSRTVGWLTSMFPVVLKLENKNDIGESLKSIKEHLRKIPNNGIGYGLLRYVNNDKDLEEELKSSPQPEIIFNYLGQMNENIISNSDFIVDSPWKLGKRSILLDQNKNGIRNHLLEINSIIIHNQLKMDFNFSKNIHCRKAIEEFVKMYEEALRNIIEHCTLSEAGGYTPSDFGDAGLNQQELDELLSNLN